jgi:hypothetical protein
MTFINAVNTALVAFSSLAASSFVPAGNTNVVAYWVIPKIVMFSVDQMLTPG